MANIKSQIKRIKTAEKARLRNRAVRSELKTCVKRVQAAVIAGDKAAADAAVSLCYKKLDKAAAKGVIHKNQAANRKSNLMQLVNTVATDEDRAAYQPVKRENVVKGGTKKAAAKAERQAAMKAAEEEKAKRREAQQKAEKAAAAKKAAAEATEEEAE